MNHRRSWTLLITVWAGVLAGCGGAKPATATPALAPETTPARADAAVPSEAKRVEVAPECKGDQLDLDALIDSGRCLASGDTPAGRAKSAAKLVIKIPDQTFSTWEFDSLTVEILNTGSASAEVVIAPAGFLVYASDGGVLGGVLGGVIEQEQAVRIVLDPAGVARFRAACPGPCIEGSRTATQYDSDLIIVRHAEYWSAFDKQLGKVRITGAPAAARLPTIVPSRMLLALRVSGTTPKPSAAIVGQLPKVAVLTVKMCLTDGGLVKSLKVLKSSGHSGFDAEMVGAMKKWRFKPFRVDGAAVPVCTAQTIIYRK